MAERGARRSPADVTAVVGHELSGPLATALLYLRIAECHCAGAGGTGALARAAVAVACSELERLKRLVDRVLEVERWGRAFVRPEHVDLGAVVRGAVDRALGAIADAALRETVEVLGPASFAGWWDEVAIEQIVRNLLSNALKFGEGRPISVVLRPSPEGAAISVCDAGLGIRAADRERIFQRRARAPAAAGGGLGLGLWMVRELATAHGGGVAVESRPGRGSTFRVLLPELSPAAAVEVPRVAYRTAATVMLRSRPTSRPDAEAGASTGSQRTPRTRTQERGAGAPSRSDLRPSPEREVVPLYP